MKEVNPAELFQGRVAAALSRIPKSSKNLELRKGLEMCLRKLKKSNSRQDVIGGYMQAAGFLAAHAPEPFQYKWQQEVFRAFSGE